MKNYLTCYNALNKLQRLAVDTIDGPLLALAGPGTGKTELLSVRAASILKNRDVAPENILILTYTNSAAKEMKERLARIIGLAGYDIEVGTFHSFANAVIQQSEEAKNYVGDKIQMDEVERVKAIEYLLNRTKGIDEIRPFRAPYTYLSEIAKKIGELKRDGITPIYFQDYVNNKEKDSANGIEEKHLKRLAALAIVYRIYEELKEGKNKEIFDDRGRYDFDDMILYATESLKREALLREEYQKRFQFVMVDEYQDTNGAQLELLFTLLDYERPNLCCVGDDDQSIYRFQGAGVGNFKILRERFPGIKVLYLEDNYRSSRELIDLSRKMIAMIPPRERTGEKRIRSIKDYKDKKIMFREFSSEEEELIYLVKVIKDLKKTIPASGDLSAEERTHVYNNIAVLVRKRSDILKVVDSLLRSGIPYATDGKEDISGERRVRQLLDILELAHIDQRDYEEKDRALYKVLSADYFEIPLSDIFKFIGYVNLKNGKDRSLDTTLLAEFLSYFNDGRKDIKFKEEGRLFKASHAIRNLISDASARPVHGILLDYIKDSGIFEYVLREYKEKEILRIRDLRALTSFVNMVKASDLANPAVRLDEFMSEIKTRKDHGLSIQGSLVTMTQDGVRVLTAHSAKGREFHSVILPFCLQNKNWPIRPMPEKIPFPPDLFKARMAISDKAALKELFLHDEIRLFYVAMTRAKSNLVFTASPDDKSLVSHYIDFIDIRKEDLPDPREEETLVNFLKKTSAKDPFIGTKATLSDLVANLTLNPTRINNYITCRRKFLYNDVLKLPGAKRKSLVFGNCVHKALEETYGEYQKAGVFPPFEFFRQAFDRELKFQGADKVIQLQCVSEGQIGKLKDWFDMTSKNPVMPIGLERKLAVTVGDNIIFTGKYDKVEWYDEKRGLVRILDYKTGKPDDHLKAIDEVSDLSSDRCDGYLRQLVSYRLLFEKDLSESKGCRAPCGALVFLEPLSEDLRKMALKKGDYVTKAIEISDDMVDELEALIKHIWKEIIALKFEKFKARDKDTCSKCDFDSICWG